MTGKRCACVACLKPVTPKPVLPAGTRPKAISSGSRCVVVLVVIGNSLPPSGVSLRPRLVGILHSPVRGELTRFNGKVSLDRQRSALIAKEAHLWRHKAVSHLLDSCP